MGVGGAGGVWSTAAWQHGMVWMVQLTADEVTIGMEWNENTTFEKRDAPDDFGEATCGSFSEVVFLLPVYSLSIFAITRRLMFM